MKMAGVYVFIIIIIINIHYIDGNILANINDLQSEVDDLLKAVQGLRQGSVIKDAGGTDEVKKLQEVPLGDTKKYEGSEQIYIGDRSHQTKRGKETKNLFKSFSVENIPGRVRSAFSRIKRTKPLCRNYLESCSKVCYKKKCHYVCWNNKKCSLGYN